MREHIRKNLGAYTLREGQAYRLGILNRGGTLICLPDQKGELEPVKTEGEMMEILLDGADFKAYVDLGLLELSVIRHEPIDSSQVLDRDREPDLEPAQNAYAHIDGILELHGTDTAVDTARFMHMAMPYFDPLEYWVNDEIISNWTKPVVICSSQEPAATLRDGHLIPNAGSDADVNLVLALSLLSDYKLGEVGVLTNGDVALRGTVANKITESHKPQFGGDPGVPIIAERTAMGVVYPSTEYMPRKHGGKKLPYVIRGSDKYEKRVLLATEPAHLAMCEFYILAKNEGWDETVEHLDDVMPKVILYGSKGAGNVQGRGENNHYDTLKQMEKYGVFVAKVPLSGGRVPKKMHYAVPGGDILGLNIEAKTARYKSQMVLAMMDELNIQDGQKSEFFNKMMTFQFGNEFLPNN